MKKNIFYALILLLIPIVAYPLTVEENKQTLLKTKRCPATVNKEAKGTESHWIKCDLTGANLAGVSLPISDIRDTIMPGADLSNSDFSGSNFSCASSTFQAYVCPKPETGSNMAGAKMTGGVFKYSNFRNVNLAGADISKADLTSANLEATNLESANLSNTDFTNANMNGVNLKKANLSGALLKGVEFGPYMFQTDVRGASFEGESDENKLILKVDWTQAIADPYTNFKNVDLRGSKVVGTTAKAKFCNAIMPDGTLNNSGCK